MFQWQLRDWRRVAKWEENNPSAQANRSQHWATKRLLWWFLTSLGVEPPGRFRAWGRAGMKPGYQQEHTQQTWLVSKSSYTSHIFTHSLELGYSSCLSWKASYCTTELGARLLPMPIHGRKHWQLQHTLLSRALYGSTHSLPDGMWLGL